MYLKVANMQMYDNLIQEVSTYSLLIRREEKLKLLPLNKERSLSILTSWKRDMEHLKGEWHME